jgi:hypothetical protein
MITGQSIEIMEDKEMIELLREFSARYGADVEFKEVPFYENTSYTPPYYNDSPQTAVETMRFINRNKKMATVNIEVDKLCYILADARMYERLMCCRNDAVRESLDQTLMLYNLQK